MKILDLVVDLLRKKKEIYFLKTHVCKVQKYLNFPLISRI